jgi:anti-sigma B factor antagonist
MPTKQHDTTDGTLVVQTTTEGDLCTVALRGELDLANAGTAETAIQEALDEATQVVVDLQELEFIDSTGIALLVGALGHNGDSAQLRFVPSRSAAVNRVLDLTGLSERLPLVE